MVEDYQLILENKGRYDDMVLDLYAVLLTGKNEIFSSLIQRRKDYWETGSDKLHESSVQVANTTHNNMVMHGSCKNVNVRDSIMVVLLTKVTDLEAILKQSSLTTSLG